VVTKMMEPGTRIMDKDKDDGSLQWVLGADNMV
jgi:hypothetical protein